MSETSRLGRLRWLCRRGMKELDVLLEGFLQRESRALQAGRWPELESFLGEEDDQIWRWVLAREKCGHYENLLHVIRGAD